MWALISGKPNFVVDEGLFGNEGMDLFLKIAPQPSANLRHQHNRPRCAQPDGLLSIKDDAG